MNKREKLAVEKKRLPSCLVLKEDVMYVEKPLESSLSSTIYDIFLESHILRILRIIQTTNWPFYRMLKGMLKQIKKKKIGSFYYFVERITTLLSGERRSKTSQCGEGFVKPG